MKQHPKQARLPLETYLQGIQQGDRYMLSKTITLMESRLPEDAEKADALLNQLMPSTGKALRLGITGAPGVGKSTLIETLGTYLTQQGIRIAVLTIDPSSTRTGGSILGDKTRMPTLSQDPLAFIRPSPAGNYLGGVGRKTRETMLLCEAAGYQVIVVETVGVGQSETQVRHMTDFFLLLLLAGAGDELQGLKKGIMELADAIVINKADGENVKYAKKAQHDVKNALHLFTAPESQVPPRVFTSSALQQESLIPIWQFIQLYQEQTTRNGFFYRNRKAQNLHWFHHTLQHFLEDHFFKHDTIKQQLPLVEKQVIEGTLSATQAARYLMTQWLS